MALGGRHLTAAELHGSNNYVWSTSSYLGRGATAVVYRGVHKVTGEPAAVKTFTTDGFHRPFEAQMKELEILKKLNHENVVKLLAIEEEVQTHNKVVIMELCGGGSLYHILDDPDNAYGLEEREFLLVLEHLTAGIEYLRGNSISHRDLKPGNIVKFITEDGRNIYKLTDFGAARSIEDDEQFTSLCGTEEYLNPDIYDKAVMKIPETKTFRPNADLWSMGATIYHVATGSLPFRPYRGRDNRAGMHFMIRNKGPGVISAYQHENGDIQWNKELPKSCLMSQGLRALITPLIASLLECRQDRIWSFNKFFNEVAEIISCKPFYLFEIQKTREITVYCNPAKTISELRLEIASQTGIEVGEQLLIIDRCLLDNDKAKLSTLPMTSVSRRILLLNRSSTEIGYQPDEGTVPKKFPVFDFNVVSLDHDAFKAKNFTSHSYVVKRSVERNVRTYAFLNEVPHALMFILHKNIEDLYKAVNHTLESATWLDKLLKLLHTQSVNFVNLIKYSGLSVKELEKLASIMSSRHQERETFNQNLMVVHSKSSALENKYIQNKELEKQWEQRGGREGLDNLKGCKTMSQTYVQDIRASWESLNKYKELRRLSFHDEQFHQLEKTKIKRGGEKLLTLSNRCNVSLRQAVRDLDCWYSGGHVALKQIECLKKELEKATQDSKDFDDSIKRAQEECEKIIGQTLSSLRSSKEGGATNASHDTSNGSINGNVEKKPSSALLKELQELKDSQSVLWNIVQENNSYLDKFQSLSSQMNYLHLEEN